ncbi:MAG: PorT family protein [Cyclobacteriaceae bacterium]|nr:PorT family protein [Cyclobacteriaceae bacterium]
MRATYFRNKFTVLGIQVASLLLMTFAAEAQHYKWAPRNNPEFDRRKFSYGFMIGLHTSMYEVSYSDQFVTQKFDTVHSVQGSFTGGFSLGFLVNLRLNEFLDLRVLPKAGFYNHKLTYYFTDKTSRTQRIETTMVELPFLLKYKSMRRGNVRMYMVGGFTPGIEASGKNDAEATTESIDIKRFNLTLDAGIGFDFYFPLFKLSQEIRFSRGIVNMLGSENSIYNQPLKGITTNTISVYFIFQ